MPKIVVCEKAEELRNISSDSIVIIPQSCLISLFTQAKSEYLQDILDTLKKLSFGSTYSHWFDIPAIEIENHQITEGLRAINKNIKVFNKKIIPLDLLQPFLKAGVIPVLIV